MKRMTRTGNVIAGTAAAALLLGGGIAVAFWTSSGTGTGTAAAGTTSEVTIDQNGSIAGLYPGGSAVAISVDITNSNASDIKLGGVTATVVSTSDAGCTPGDFVIGDSTWGGGTVTGGGGSITVNAGTIRMVNASTNQNACKGATINLAFSATGA